MTVRCNKTYGDFPSLVLPRDINQPLSNQNFVASSEWYTINDTLSGYSISEDKEYKVYGILIYEQLARYLLVDDNGIPAFFPSGLFSLLTGELEFDWKVCEYTIENSKLIVVGYSEITEKYDSLIDLVDGAECAIQKFQVYKQKSLFYSF